ncbi:heavy-metal-associated domain-containing protein [Mangrovimonas aestuarii]|uniref:heavy-metal-associated domain-containing protein n=1 Tax=Mangrovimonas aestuarii TaxID=3018443 RepID=UPI002377FDA4|nr:heavy-metal-associated domain-containing protein [Mangrovimonas aestuarii]
MKKLMILGMLLFGITAFSQNKNARATVEVDGVCLMCKSRIEKACIKTKGVKSAVWDVNTHQLSLIYDERKTNLETIQNNVAAVGHDTQEVIATEEAYNSVHACCKYRDIQVQEDHQNENLAQPTKS